MPIFYFDKMLDENIYHPALLYHKRSPLAKMVRYGSDGKSVFKWNRSEALAMYKWYELDYKRGDIVDEFGELISTYNFRRMIAKSHFEVKNQQVSKRTIADEYAYELQLIEERASAISVDAEDKPQDKEDVVNGGLKDPFETEK